MLYCNCSCVVGIVVMLSVVSSVFSNSISSVNISVPLCDGCVSHVPCQTLGPEGKVKG